MELVQGKTLAELIPSDGMNVESFLEVAIPLADAVAAAHDAGVVHRDLKPGNVMVDDDGRVKVLDFGVARKERVVRTSWDSEAPTASMTSESVVAGTLQYMAPEQLECGESSARGDVFALGAVFYEMLTGRKAFDATSVAGVISRILSEDPPDAMPRSIPRSLGTSSSRVS